MAVKNWARGAAPAVLVEGATPIKNNRRRRGIKNKRFLNFIGADYIRIELALGAALAAEDGGLSLFFYFP
ncbi:MAG TPA: hypothetical protein VFO91_04735, partial [Anaerolineales bacterium]|nr:hypothetical protein [Anaerolineales bacterium]